MPETDQIKTSPMSITETAEPEVDVQQVRATIDLIKRNEIRFVDLWFTEMRGRSWRITIRADMVDEKFFTSVVTLDGRTIGGSWEGFIQLRPDPAAVFVDPVATVPTVALVCDVLSSTAGEGYPSDPRRALKRALFALSQVETGATCAVGAEPEFFLLDGDRPVPEETQREFLRTMAAALGDAGMQIDWFRIGPAAGQGRVQMRSTDALRTADQVVIYKHVARRLAQKEKMTACFLPKPLAADGAAGMPLHHALWRDKTNLFYDPDGWAFTSETGLWFAGGLVRHTPALLALCAPTMNSYRRLLPGFLAPTELVLSKHRSSAVCRVPAGSTGPAASSRRVKFCCADSSANPYLAMAATIAAGLDGMRNKIDPPLEHADGPDSRPFPHSLESALAAMEQDRDFLVKDGIFTDEIIRAWSEEVWRLQVVPVRSRPHPWELRLEGDL